MKTLPKVGYQFCALVEQEAESRPVSQPDAIPLLRKKIPVQIGAVAAILGIAAWLPQVQRSQHMPALDFSRAAPLTSFPGQETHPAVSPDGSKIAFIWNGEDQSNFDIYVLGIGSTAPVRLTFDNADELCPAWSPDGKKIAFIRRTNSRSGELMLIPADGGPEHKIREVINQELREPLPRLISLDWTPDGKGVAASHRAPNDPAERIYLFSVTGEARPLTSAPGVSAITLLHSLPTDGCSLSADCRDLAQARSSYRVWSMAAKPSGTSGN